MRSWQRRQEPVTTTTTTTTTTTNMRMCIIVTFILSIIMPWTFSLVTASTSESASFSSANGRHLLLHTSDTSSIPDHPLSQALSPLQNSIPLPSHHDMSISPISQNPLSSFLTKRSDSFRPEQTLTIIRRIASNLGRLGSLLLAKSPSSPQGGQEISLLLALGQGIDPKSPMGKLFKLEEEFMPRWLVS